MEVATRHAYPPVGRCIYCGTTEKPLSEEHIIPYALDGHLVLPEATCPRCARITSEIELVCTRAMFGPLRVRLGLQTRRKKKRPTKLPIMLVNPDGSTETRLAPSDKFPRVCVGMKLPFPGIVLGHQPSERIANVHLVTAYADDEVKALALKNKQGAVLQMLDPPAFFKLLAKIAHVFAVAQLGVSGFKHRLPPLILGKGDTSDTLPYLIGGDTEEPTPDPHLHYLHQRRLELNGVAFRFVTIRLFAMMGMPNYHVIVGEDLTGVETKA